jgi:endonuclease-3
MAVSRAVRKAKSAKPRRRGPARLGPAEVRPLFERLRAANPSPRTELVYASPYQLLVSVILSAQATDKSVNLATGPLFRSAPTPAAIAALGETGLAAHVRTIGLWRMKAKNVIAATRMILAEHGGEVPRNRAALEALPGVGRKTANVVMNTAFGESTIAVDTHIFRVANRTGLAPGSTVRAVEDGLLRVVPEEFLRDAHHWLILHGRYVCKARKPLCPQCAIRDLCRYPDKAGATSSSARKGR